MAKKPATTKKGLKTTQSSSSSRRSSTTSAFLSTSSLHTSQPCVIIEFGNAYIRIGFAGEPTPRHILPSNSFFTKFVSSSSDDQDWDAKLLPLMEDIFTHHLLIRPKNHRVIVLEPIISPRLFRKSLTDILLTSLKVPSLLFINDPAFCPLHTIGSQIGMIVDIGAQETRIIASFQGFGIPNTFHSVPCGYSQMLETFMDLHNLQQVRQDFEITSLEQAQYLFETAKSHFPHEYSQISYMPEKKVFCKLLLFNPNKEEEEEEKEKQIPIYFRDLLLAWKTCFDFDTDTITNGILSCYQDSPIDLRIPLIQNVLIIGGGSLMFPSDRYFTPMFLESLSANTTTTKSSSEKIIKKHFREKTTPFHKSLVNWIGASIMGATPHKLSNEKWIDEKDWNDDDGTQFSSSTRSALLFDWVHPSA